MLLCLTKGSFRQRSAGEMTEDETVEVCDRALDMVVDVTGVLSVLDMHVAVNDVAVAEDVAVAADVVVVADVAVAADVVADVAMSEMGLLKTSLWPLLQMLLRMLQWL